jgi:hypothetical protein
LPGIASLRFWIPGDSIDGVEPEGTGYLNYKF